MVLQYLPGIAFLVLISAAVAALAATLIDHRGWAVGVSAAASILLLKGWAYVALDGFDAIFLLIVAAVAVATALSIVPIVARITRRVRALA